MALKGMVIHAETIGRNLGPDKQTGDLPIKRKRSATDLRWMRWQRLLLAPALLPALIGCRTTVTERLAPPPPSTVHHASAARSWNVIEGSAVLGRVILFEAANTPQGAVYMVQNAWSQDLGLIDSLGRAWRYRPHEPEAQWVATGTVADGAARILGIDSACTLEEVSLVDIPSGP